MGFGSFSRSRASIGQYDSSMRPAEAFLSSAWQARLELGFERAAAGTVLARRVHSGPLRVQKPLYPEGTGICHAILLHPPAGIAGGDRLDLSIDVAAGAQALLTTPGAGKWYRSAGLAAAQTVHINLGAGATAEWLPQESIVFDGAQAQLRTAVSLAAGARYLGVDTLCFGRRASGESFKHGSLRLASDITLAGRPLWRERGVVDGGSGLMASPIGLAGFTVCSTVIAAGADIDAPALAACRAAVTPETAARTGVTVLPGLFVGRYLGHSAEAARTWFVRLWETLRPIFIGRPASVPRIWNT